MQELILKLMKILLEALIITLEQFSNTYLVSLEHKMQF